MKPQSGGIQTVIVTAQVARYAPIKSVHSAWVQYTSDGHLQARAVVADADCPEILIDWTFSAMSSRATPGAEFLRVCSADIPNGTRLVSLVETAPMSEPPGVHASHAAENAWFKAMADWVKNRGIVNSLALPIPSANPRRILVLGDTGCRIKGDAVQACNDPAKWPFPQLAASAAKLKPDLVIHVGDYLYRENACPPKETGCAGTPFGDNWPTWAADFFDPAAPLLAAAPWVFVRGNHEDCQRAGPGWLRLLGPNAFDDGAACPDHLAPYSVPIDSMKLIVMDDASAPDTSIDAGWVPTYQTELAALASGTTPEWLVLHRPIWAAVSGPLGLPVGGNATLIAAAGDRGIPKPVELMLAGHIHTFEAINYDAKVPPQILAGHGGDNLDATPADLKGAIFQGHSGVSVKDGLSVGGFGFLLMTKTDTGWTIDLYDVAGAVTRQCVFAAGRVDCPAPPK